MGRGRRLCKAVEGGKKNDMAMRLSCCWIERMAWLVNLKDWSCAWFHTLLLGITRSVARLPLRPRGYVSYIHKTYNMLGQSFRKKFNVLMGLKPQG